MSSPTYTCQSECSASAVQAAGGYICITQLGWKPPANFMSPSETFRASCPFHMKASRSLTMLTVWALISVSRSSRSKCNTTTWPAVPPMTKVSEMGQSAIFWMPRRGSSLYGSKVPTWRKHGIYRIVWYITNGLKSHFHLHCMTKFNPLRPTDAILRHRSGSTLAQVMACCLTAPSHHLNQCCIIISKVYWHSSEGSFLRDTSATIH